MTDDLEHLLKPDEGQSANPDAFAASLRILKRRATIRRAVSWLGCLLLLGSGVGLGWLIKPDAVAVEVPVPVQVPVTAPESSGMLARAAEESPDHWEQKAELADDRDVAAAFYKQAGDAYLTRQRYDEAARCYRLHLARGGASQRPFQTNDSWLLCSIKTTYSPEE
jgi:hypothetical protein